MFSVFSRIHHSGAKANAFEHLNDATRRPKLQSTVSTWLQDGYDRESTLVQKCSIKLFLPMVRRLQSLLGKSRATWTRGPTVKGLKMNTVQKRSSTERLRRRTCSNRLRQSYHSRYKTVLQFTRLTRSRQSGETCYQIAANITQAFNRQSHFIRQLPIHTSVFDATDAPDGPSLCHLSVQRYIHPNPRAVVSSPVVGPASDTANSCMG